MTKLTDAVSSLDMSLSACSAVLRESKEPLQRRLAWLASDLERLAGEAYRLADDAGDDPGPNPATACECIGVHHDECPLKPF